ncbi:hypothetical protein [Streptomyces radicis]|uniref:Uncharacterized protein n=1 Tax=Streptomyces radicis TaxID=1750517 RepID=A0A3A9WHK7_9ACTN|nr:hypothetical protein [Streptomyces radicis]RKN12508.1 hypothetical protein D7319_00645 [Streptomyces radicis]RKN27724.1 hypothetical protein D7318_02245 [Streptomyces radicis]
MTPESIAPEGVDAYLADAAVPFPTPDPAHADAADEIAASRRRIEQDLAETLWQEVLTRDDHARALTGAATRPRPEVARDRLPVALLEQSAQDLSELSRMVISTSHAPADIAELARSTRLAPEGALIFACLLHLADRPDGAQFWWQFSAGAGKSTAALCLYLMHLQRGETRDADHWARQATELEVLDHRRSLRRRALPDAPRRGFYAWEQPCLYHRGFTTVESMLLRTVSSLGADTDDEPCARSAPPCEALTEVVQRLPGDHDPHFGDIPRPDPDLAARLEECIAS